MNKSKPRNNSLQWLNILAVSIGIAITLLCFYPGYIGGDSLWQYNQGHEEKFTYWHPPVMAWVWSHLDKVIRGPAGLFLLHTLLFWSAIGVIISQAWKPCKFAPLIILGIGTFPPVFVNLGNICKDVGMVNALLFAFAMFFTFHHKRSAWRLLLGLISLWYAFAVRHNAPMAVLPLTVWLGIMMYDWVFENNREPVKLKIILGLSIFLTLLLSTRILNKHLVPDEKWWALRSPLSTPLQQTLVYDLATISIQRDMSLLPEYLNSKDDPFTMEDLKSIFDNESVFSLYWGGGEVRRMRVTFSLDNQKDLLKKWVEGVTSNPWIYFSHRVKIFSRLLGFNTEHVVDPFEYPNGLAHVNILYNPTFFNKMLMPIFEALKDSIFFRGWIYFLIVIGFTVKAAWQRSSRFLPSVALGTSATLYILPLFFLDVDGDFRYNLWTIYAALIFPVLYFSQKYKTNNDERTCSIVEKKEGNIETV